MPRSPSPRVLRYLNVIAPLFIFALLTIGCQELAYVTEDRLAEEPRETSQEAKSTADNSDLSIGKGEAPLLTAQQLITDLLADPQNYRETYVGMKIRIHGEIVGSHTRKRLGVIHLGMEDWRESNTWVEMRGFTDDHIEALSEETRLPPTHCVVLPDSETGVISKATTTVHRVIKLGECHIKDLPAVNTSPVFTAQQLVDEQDLNPVRFIVQYGNKWVRVSGTVKQIQIHRVTLTIKDGGLDLHDLSTEAVVSLNKGEQMSAECVLHYDGRRNDTKLVECLKR